MVSKYLSQDYIGKKFGRLTILSLYKDNKYDINAKCKCDCGKITNVKMHNLLSGRTKSCGCLKNERKNCMIGRKFGKLTIFKRIENDNSSQPKYICRCDCGNEIVCFYSNLISGRTKSCGCLQSNYKHGYTNTKIYRKHNIFKHYHKDEMCKEFQDFIYFKNWADKQENNEQSIARYNLCDIYDETNTKFDTFKYIQRNNKKSNHYITFNNQTHCLTEWAEIMNLSRQGLYKRLKRMPIQYALTSEKKSYKI